MKNLLSNIFYSFREYNVYEAMKKTQSTLSKLQSRIMNGDYQAASLAFDQLEELEQLHNDWLNQN